MLPKYFANSERVTAESGTEPAHQYRNSVGFKVIGTTPTKHSQRWRKGGRRAVEATEVQLSSTVSPGLQTCLLSPIVESAHAQTSEKPRCATSSIAQQAVSPGHWVTNHQVSLSQRAGAACLAVSGSAATNLKGPGCAMATRSPESRRQQHASDFTAMVEHPDARRRRQLEAHHGSRKAEIARRKWRAECLTIARQRNLSHVEHMRLVWVSTAAQHRSGASVVVVVGAHYRSGLASLENVMLHVVKEFDKLGGRPWVLLYFNADAPMRPLPNTVWFQELHAALPDNHRETLEALYLVHPKSHRLATRAWLFMLEGQDPQFYGKVQPINNLKQLLSSEFTPGIRHEVPQLVLDYCARHPGAS